MSDFVLEGYNYQLVNGTPPDEYICLLCHLLARDARQVNCCGKIFCQSCLAIIAKTSQFSCPCCHMPLAGAYFKDTRTDSAIRSLQIYCTNKERGCTWQGNIKDIDTHIQNCPKQMLTCCKCMQQMHPNHEASHLKYTCIKRDFTCVHCQLVGKYDYITGRHQLVCPDVILPCKNRCLQKVKRCEMEQHRDTCPKEIIICPYSGIGCEKKMKREDMKQHEEDETKSHLKYAVDRMTKKETCPVLIKVSGFSEHKGKQDDWYSSGFYTSAGGYKLRFKLHAYGKDSHIPCSVNLMPGEYDDILEWPFQGEVTVELLNQLEDKNHYKIAISFNDKTPEPYKKRKEKEDTKGWGTMYHFIPHTKLGLNSSTNTQYLMNDTLYFRVSVNVHSKTKPWLAGAM